MEYSEGAKMGISCETDSERMTFSNATVNAYDEFALSMMTEVRRFCEDVVEEVWEIDHNFPYLAFNLKTIGGHL